MKRLAAIAVIASLGGCLPHPPPPPPPYRAVAQAPAHWTLIIDDKFVTFIPAPGQQPLLQTVPRPIIGVAGEIYQTPRVNVNIVHQPCRDGRTSFAYPDTVQVHVDGRLHAGCGGL
jgi:hypothetical protein